MGDIQKNFENIKKEIELLINLMNELNINMYPDFIQIINNMI